MVTLLFTGICQRMPLKASFLASNFETGDPLAIVAALVAELIGTFFLTAVVVLLSCSPGAGPDAVPIAVGLIVVVAILTFGPVRSIHSAYNGLKLYEIDTFIS